MPDVHRWCARVRMKGRNPHTGATLFSSEPCAAAERLVPPPPPQPARPITAAIPSSTYPDSLGASWFTLDLAEFQPLAQGDLVNVYLAFASPWSSPAEDWMLYLPRWDKGQRIDLAKIFANAEYVRVPGGVQGAVPGPERRPIRKVVREQRRRHVVDRDAALGLPLQAAVMGVAVEHHVDRVAVERVFQPAAAQERHAHARDPAPIEHDAEKWIPVFGKHHAPTIT